MCYSVTFFNWTLLCDCCVVRVRKDQRINKERGMPVFVLLQHVMFVHRLQSVSVVMRGQTIPLSTSHAMSDAVPKNKDHQDIVSIRRWTASSNLTNYSILNDEHDYDVYK